MSFRLDLFDDFHLHGASAPEWQQRYLQLSPGAMRSSLAEVSVAGLHVFRKWMSERVVQQGCLPSGQICFAMPLGGPAAAGSARAQGRELRPDSLFVLRSGEEFTLQRPPGMALLAVTFEREDFRRLQDGRPWSAAAEALLARPVVDVAVPGLQALRLELLGLFERPVADPLSSWAVFDQLTALFEGGAESRQALGSASASFIVTECHRLVAARPAQPPSVDELCQRLRTSRRSLQNSFRQVADTTPLHYLRSVRLAGVRRQLLSTPSARLSIAQAATDQGFDHLSHFSARYRALFGELPSQTVRP